MRVWTEHYGCTLNQGETLMLKELAIQAGYLEATTPEEADVIIFGSCIVIDTTERKMWRRLEELKHKKVVIGGCLPPVNEKRLRELIHDLSIIPPGDMTAAAEVFDLHDVELVPSVSGNIAILPIATGCQGACSYCITRLARGKLRSKPIAELVSWAEDAVNKGAKEIRLSAQDTGVYGNDIGTNLPALLNAITAIEGKHMVRIGMMNPSSLEAMEEPMIKALKHPKMFKFLHIPIQSGSNDILTAMGRGYTVEQAEALIERLRASITGLTISTDIIVGFPGEKETDFQKTLDLMDRILPDSINITRFSERSGTKAINMLHKVDGRTSKPRSTKMTEKRFEIYQKKKAQMVGREVRALVIERGSPGTVLARDSCYNTIVVKGEPALGSWIDLRITGVGKVYLLAEQMFEQV